MLKANISYSLVVLLLVSFALFPSAQQAFAVVTNIDDQLSCDAIVGLSWDSTDPLWGPACQIDGGTFIVGSGDILNSSVQLKIGTTGTLIIEDDGTVNISNTDMFDGIYNLGIIEQSGTINYTGMTTSGFQNNAGIWTLFCGVINNPPLQNFGQPIIPDCNEEIIFPLTSITVDTHISNVVVDGDPIGNPGSVPIVIENDLLISNGATLTSPYKIQNFAFITFSGAALIDTSGGGTVEIICSNSDFRGFGGSGTISPNFVDIPCDEPTGVSDSGYTTAEDTPSLPIDVLSNDLPGNNHNIPRNDPTLSVYSVGQGTNGVVTTDGNTVTYTPNPNSNGLDSFTYTLIDGNGVVPFPQPKTSVSITVTPVNDSPVLDPIGDKSVDELVELTFTASASDADIPADTLTFSLVGAPTGATIDSNTGVFSWTPSEGQTGDFTFDVQVDDGNGGIVSETITVTVSVANQAPILDPIGDKSIEEETLLTFIATASDADDPADTLTFSLVGAPTGATIGSTTGVFTWTPTELQVGPFTFDVIVADDGTPSLSDSETITVTVSIANQAPILDPIGDKSIEEETLLTFIATASDDPADTLTFSLVGAPTGATIGSTTGVFTWTPTELQVGPFTFDVIVADDGTPSLSDSETITVTITEGPNNPPVLDPIGDKSVDELVELTFTASASDADIPADTLTFSLVDGTSGSVPTGATIDPNTGVFSWTPSEGQTGDFTFDVQVDDGNGGIVSETITVTVSVANQAPILDPIGDKSVDELVELTFTASASDDPADILTFSLVGAPTGATIGSTTGVFTWTPLESDGPATFPITVIVTDNGAPSLDDFETITITVNEVNIAPILDPIGDKSVDELVELTFTASASDADIPADTLTFSLVDGTSGSVPTGATIDPNTGVFSWTPTELQGPDIFTFDVQVDDGNGGIVSETITITVNEVNIAPICFDATTPTPLIYQTNHKMVPFDYDMDYEDADGDTVTLSILSIFQDEPTNDGGDGDKSPDADLTKSEIRAERSGFGDGRVYVITIQADDGNDGTCRGSFTIGIPHDKKDLPVDSLVRYDSTIE